MRKIFAFSGILLASTSFASDHNNIDSGRPLRFEDAYSIAFREQTLEFGYSLFTRDTARPNHGFSAEWKSGFAKNKEFSIGFHRFSLGSANELESLELSYFHGLRRELNNLPALAYRVEVGVPTRSGSRGADLLFRGISTKSLKNLDKVHLNVEVEGNTDKFSPSWNALLGYSVPLGYPSTFDRTLVAELGLLNIGRKQSGTFGVGLRQQLSPYEIFDLGATLNFSGGTTGLKLAIGYSRSF